MSAERDRPAGESRESSGRDAPPEDAVLEEAERKFLAAREAFIADQESKSADRRRT